MFKENYIDKILRKIKKLIPRKIFNFLAPFYHYLLSLFGAFIFGFPSRKLKIIAVTGTKGKSTTVYIITKIFEKLGIPVAAIGSLGMKIRDREWPNTLKMTMPGRLKIHKFLAQAKKAGVKYVVLEATSEGIAQKRLTAVNIDCAVYTNLHKEHLESHGSFENYLAAKQKLFQMTPNIHILNIDDRYFEKFANFPARNKLTYGMNWGLMSPEILKSKNLFLDLKILGSFNKYNALAALCVAQAYGLDMAQALEAVNSISSVPGRMEMMESKLGFKAVVDYAHTPDSLEAVYSNLKPQGGRLICVLGSAGGGRDKWKRPEFGEIAGRYCDELILTDEDPFDENPEEIVSQIIAGLPAGKKFQKIMNRQEAIAQAIQKAQKNDVIVITGKGSETSMALKDGKKIPWSDKGIVEEYLGL